MTVTSRINNAVQAAISVLTLRHIESVMEDRQHRLRGIADGRNQQHVWSDDILLAERDNNESDRECLDILRGRVRE